MATYGLSRIRADTESRTRDDKKEQENRRLMLTLCVRYLQQAGYNESAARAIQESGLRLDRFDLADNIELPIIVKEFQDYYNIKYNKYPTMMKTVQTAPEERKKVPPRSKNPGKKPARDSSTERQQEPLELQGQQVQQKKQPESNQDYYENRLLKPLPDYPPDLRDLAQTIQRDIITTNPNVNFSTIVGLNSAKRLLKEAVLMPMKYPHLFTGILEPWKGILLFGPPGTGKTMLAKAAASECRTVFFNISASSVVSKWRGDSEKLIRVLFELARHYQPATIFIDEIDSIMSARDSGEHEGSRRMKTELLIQLDGLQKQNERVFILAASNLPWDLDSALLRRLEKRIVVSMPNLEARIQMLQLLLPQERAIGLDYNKLGAMLEGFSGSDIKLLCKEAAMAPIRRLMMELENMDEDTVTNWHIPAEQKNTPSPQPVSENDFLEALNKTKPANSISEDQYMKWFSDFGST